VTESPATTSEPTAAPTEPGLATPIPTSTGG
jgi:hypothetical protein